MFTVASATVATETHTSGMSNNECRKCGTFKKSGKSSCCAPGGAWFNNCGNSGSSKFAHTWSEGMQACTGVAEKVQVQLPYHTTNENHVIISTTQSVKDAETRKSKGYNNHHSKLTFLITVLIPTVQIWIA